jgi:hypothetical protein
MKTKQEASPEMTWREAIEFLIRLASIGDPERLRPSEVLKHVEDCQQFLDIEGKGQPARELAQAKERPATLKPTIEAVHRVVEAVANRARFEFKFGSTRAVLDASRLGDRRGTVFTEGALVDVVMAQALDDLGDAEPWQVCKCLWPDCGKIFVADRKGQKYCQPKCASAAAAARFQERKKARS